MWIGVDLDGTLAEYHGWEGPERIGKPIPEMVARVKRWLADGKEVRVFTARVGPQPTQEEVSVARSAIERWCIDNLGQVLQVTATKDFEMGRLFDDRCIQVETNTGRIIG